MKLPAQYILLILFVLFVAVCCGGLVSCSNNPPTVEQTVCSRIVRFNSQTQALQQTFSVFSAIQDKDGFQDLENVYILDDSSQLLWHITGSDLQTIDNDNRHWVGNRNLKPIPGEPIPAGKLRIVVYDRAGNKALSETGLPLIDADVTLLVPRAIRRDGWLEISPVLTANSTDREIVTLDWSGAELGRFRVQAATVKIEAIILGRKPNDVQFTVQDNLYNGSLLISSGPW